MQSSKKTLKIGKTNMPQVIEIHCPDGINTTKKFGSEKEAGYLIRMCAKIMCSLL